jgi:N-ethylmaleimide reductase
VHKAGGLIFLQLWHVGRISHPSLQPDGMLPVAPSAIKPSGEAFIENENGEGELVPFVTPRALQIEEMPYIIRQYARGSRNALEAGFDGVEVHAANGYLLDQFINSRSNHRADGYGGTIENRARLLMEVVEAVSDVWGQDRVGVRLSPLGTFNDMGDDDPEMTFGHVAEKLNGGALAYLHIVNPAVTAIEKESELDPGALRMLELMRERYRGTFIIAGGFDHDTAESWLQQGKADLIAFGRKFLANPDLPERFRSGASLNADDPTTYYGGGAKGYTDYPTLAQERGEEPHPCVDERCDNADVNLIRIGFIVTSMARRALSILSAGKFWPCCRIGQRLQLPNGSKRVRRMRLSTTAPCARVRHRRGKSLIASIYCKISENPSSGSWASLVRRSGKCSLAKRLSGKQPSLPRRMNPRHSDPLPKTSRAVARAPTLGATTHSSAEWIARQLTGACGGEWTPS